MCRANCYDALTLKFRAFAFLDVGLRRWRDRGGLGAFDFLLAGILLANGGARGVKMPRRVLFHKTRTQPVSKFMEYPAGLCVVVLHIQESGFRGEISGNISFCANFRQRSIVLTTV